MQILLDALLIAVFALFVFRGFSRGLTRSVFRLGRMILSFAITALLGLPYFAILAIDSKFLGLSIFLPSGV